MTLKEFSLARKYWEIYYFLAVIDLNSRFRRSKLGLFWIVLQHLLYVFGIGIVWTRVWGMNMADFIPFLAIGISIWNYLANSLNDCSMIFIISHGYLKQMPLPQEVFILRTYLTQSIYFLITFSTSIIVALLFGRLTFCAFLYSFPGILMLLILFYYLSGLVAYFGIRYRDIQHAIPSMLNFAFIVTPVIYSVDMMKLKGAVANLIYYNPFAIMIEIVRYPLMNGEFADIKFYLSACLLIVITAALRYIAANKWKKQVPFWS